MEMDIQLTNTSSDKKTFVFQVPTTDKYILKYVGDFVFLKLIICRFEPPSGKIKKGGREVVRVSLQFKCTARVNDSVVLAALDVGHVVIPLDIESELSTSIDFDEITLVEPPIGEGKNITRNSWKLNVF